jgi:glyoxylase-like metal-dependent hydrolase (beta-lactamase superfamily II)
MKKSIFIALVALIPLLSVQHLNSQDQESAPVSLEKITDRAYVVKGGQGSNGGVIIGEGGVLIIDSKMNEESVNQTLDAVRTLTDKPVMYLVNTHSDGDHIMGNRYFPDPVTFIAHENCRKDFFKEFRGRASDWDEPEFFPFTPSITFLDQMNVWLGTDKVELHYFGVGHTTGDIFVYVPEDQIAFMGDLYFSTRPQLIHSHKNGNSFDYVKTMTAMLKNLDAEIFLSGHSDPVGRSEIKAHIEAMTKRQKKVKDLIKKDMILADVLKEFEENESRLVTTIYTELTGN